MKVSYIILTRNRRADVLENLALLRQQKHQKNDAEPEVVLVDNGSEDGTVSAVKKKHAYVKCVENKKNLGVAGGRNVGIKAATGELLFFIDDDAVLRDPDATKKVVTKFEQDPKLGILGFQERSYYDPQVLAQWCYGRKRAREWATREFDAWTFPGVGHAIRYTVFEKCGLYPERYFYATEEIDLALRSLDAGWRIAYTPEVKIYHKVSPQTRANFRYYFDLRNNIWLAMRLLPWWYGVPRVIGFTGLVTLKAVRTPQHLPRVLHAWRDAWRARREVLHERQPIKSATLRHIRELRRA